MASFFNKVQTSVAHSSKLQGIGQGSLSQLNDVIGAEKRYLDTSQRLSGDGKKSADALKEWANLDLGEDLHDICAKVSMLFDRLSSAEQKYTESLSEYRILFKTLRTKEEDHIELGKRKSSLQSKIDAADKLLAKTSMEHRERLQREQRLSDLTTEMASMEHTIATEDARLGDMRRTTVQKALGRKLAAMLELAERTTIIAEMSKLLIAEVPVGQTQPGYPRQEYRGHADTARVMEDAFRCLDAVQFKSDPLPSAEIADGADASAVLQAQSCESPESTAQLNQSIQSTPASVPSGFPQRPQRSRERMASSSSMNKRNRLSTSRTYSSSSVGRVSSAGLAESAASPVLETPPQQYLQPSVTSYDYATREAAQPPEALREAEVQPQIPVERDTYRADRQSFPLSVRGDPRSSLAYMDNEGAAFEDPPRDQSNYQGPQTQATPAYGTSSRPARAQQDNGHSQPPQLSNSKPNGVTHHVPPPPIVVPKAPPPASALQLPSMPASKASSRHTPPQSPRPPNTRGDSSLGSRHGYDMPAYSGETVPTSPNRYTAPPPATSGYSYHRANEPPGRVTAGAFRRAGNSTQSNSSYTAGTQFSPTQPSMSSPSALIRESYLARSAVVSETSPAVDVDNREPYPTLTAPLRLNRRSMEVSVPPSGSASGRNTSVQTEQAHAPIAPPGYVQSSTPPWATSPPAAGFASAKFVTRLE